MRLNLSLLAMLNCIFLVLSTGLRADTLSVSDRVWILSKTYQSITTYFAHWQGASYLPEQADSVYHEFIPRALEANKSREFSALMREYLALLNNGHCWYTDFEENQTKLPLGIACEYLNGEWVITSSVVSQIKTGDRLDSVDGLAAEAYYQAHKKYLCASNEYARRSSFKRWVLPTFLDTVYTVGLHDRNGAIRTVTVNRVEIPRESPQSTTGRWLVDAKLAYIKIPAFTDPEFEKVALRLLDGFREAPALVIDIRGNGGGSTPADLIEALMDRPYRWYAESTPLSIALYRYYADNRGGSWDKFRRSSLIWQSPYEDSRNNIFKGRLILLVDRGTASAAEDFVVPFKDNGRAVIMGETSRESTGQPYMFRFGNTGSIGIGAKRAYFPDESPFEGVGVNPDIEVTISRGELYDGVDPVLKQAIEEAGNL